MIGSPNAANAFFPHRHLLGIEGLSAADITALLDMVQAGRLKAVIDESFPLERAPEALARLEQRQVFGKLVIVP